MQTLTFRKNANTPQVYKGVLALLAQFKGSVALLETGHETKGNLIIICENVCDAQITNEMAELGFRRPRKGQLKLNLKAAIDRPDAMKVMKKPSIDIACFLDTDNMVHLFVRPHLKNILYKTKWFKLASESMNMQYTELIKKQGFFGIEYALTALGLPYSLK